MVYVPFFTGLVVGVFLGFLIYGLLSTPRYHVHVRNNIDEFKSWNDNKLESWNKNNG